MNNIKDLCDDGFKFGDLNGGIDSIAFSSLKKALKSYFSTYESIALEGNSFFKELPSTNINCIEYIEHYSETIIHFQHFFELICKDILRKEHELLVLNIDNKHEVLFDLVNGNKVNQSELEKINTIEFDRTLKRLCNLITTGKLDSSYSFFNDKHNKIALEELNKIRNRIWHRGSYVLNYQSFDIYIGKYILPIIYKIMNLSEYSSFGASWKYANLDSKIDPLLEIIKECKSSTPMFDKLAFLKELGRAAYENPLTKNSFKVLREIIVQRTERIALNELPHPNSKYHYISKCPVCGTKSLVKYEDSDGDLHESGEFYVSYWTWIYNIKCYCCSFELQSSGMKNPSEYGYKIPAFWFENIHEEEHEE
ncbi:hypothetical protein [Lysinibacillus capsici]|uniref:hypothetical protein n=1 Tax=Lysinibacillus capsici TaxID=2115968 RepID=UPI003CFFD8E7